MIIIDVIEEFQESTSDQVLLQAAQTTLLSGWQGENPSLTIRITGQEEIQELNQHYRDTDKPTDVLAFPADFRDPDLDSFYLGDVVISFPQAQAQAEEKKHPVDAELQLLVVHGILHLMGHDHSKPADKEAMWALQSRILGELGLDIDVGEN